MIKLSKLRKNKGIRLEIPNTENIVDKLFVKKLRNKLGLSQFAFSEAVGVSVKTVEKWESGDNNINGSAKKLIFLLDKHDCLIDDLYKIIDDSKPKITRKDYIVKILNNNMSLETMNQNSYFKTSSHVEARYGVSHA